MMTHRPYTPPAWQSKLLSDGRVTLLVVPLKVQPYTEEGVIYTWSGKDSAFFCGPSDLAKNLMKHGAAPYAPGDLIWCRETYIGPYAYEVNEYKPKDWGNKPIWFPADGPIPERFVGQFWHKARSPVTMPKWAARTWLRCTGVEVRRVQTISHAETIRNGRAAYANSLTIDCDTPTPRDDFAKAFPNFAANPWAAFTTVEKISKEDV